MKALAINGSSRKNGNTAYLLQRCLDQLANNGIEGELVQLAGKTIKPCTACRTCYEKMNKKCTQEEDAFHEVFEKMQAADIIVVGSPTYFGSATSQMMALLQRAGYVSRANGNLFSRKLGGPVAVARRAGENFTYAQLMYFFMVNDMVVPGSTYWNVSVAKAPGDAEKDTEAIETIDRFAANLAWLADKLNR